MMDSPNLGGLARTSEIFAVDTLVVRSLKACKDQVFKSVGEEDENKKIIIVDKCNSG